MKEQLLAIIGTACLACFGWVFHLGNRVTVVETKVDTFEKWLERVEGKLDRVIED